VIWFFWYFTLISFIIYVICLNYARSNKNNYLQELLILPLFGFLLEYSTIKVFNIYSYNHDWPLLFLGVPVSVAISWANIVFSARLLCDTTNLGKLEKSMMQALVAVSLDFAMDPNSIRIGPLWTWDIPENSQYFGIPWANYFGWIMAVFLFSYSFQYFTAAKAWQKKYSSILTLITSIIGLAIVNGLYVLILPINTSTDIQNIIVIGLVIIAFILFIIRSKLTLVDKTNLIPLLVFGSFLLSYLLLGILYNVFLSIPSFIPIFSLVFIGQSILIFRLSNLNSLFGKNNENLEV
jgi:uncharacterized membrane protein